MTVKHVEAPPSQVLLEPFRLQMLERQQDPIYKLKPLALVEEKSPYEYERIEESLVNYLLEKVVIMREVPFMRAID